MPAATARVAKRAFRKGALAIRARDQLGSWSEDADLAPAYGVRGAPGISPAQLAMITVPQFARLDWKYALGLALEGFDHTVLSEFRARLVAGSLELQILDRLLDRLKELGLMKAGGGQRTDSTHVLQRASGT